MLDIAMNAGEACAPIPIAQVAERQKISLTYLEQIFCRLRRPSFAKYLKRMALKGRPDTLGQLELAPYEE